MKNNRYWTTHLLFNSIINEEAIILVDPFSNNRFVEHKNGKWTKKNGEQKSECILNGIRYVYKYISRLLLSFNFLSTILRRRESRQVNLYCLACSKKQSTSAINMHDFFLILFYISFDWQTTTQYITIAIACSLV